MMKKQPHLYVCQQCQNLFAPPDAGDSIEAECPECGSRAVEKLDITPCRVRPAAPPAWQYQCHECGHEFEMPVPRGPTEERSRTCPKCHSRNIERTNIYTPEFCEPGG